MAGGRRLDIWREVYEIAGELRLDPGGFSLHELYTMLWAHRRAIRDETALVMTAVLSPYRKKAGKQIDPADFNPYRTKVKKVDEWVGIDALKMLIPGGGDSGS